MEVTEERTAETELERPEGDGEAVEGEILPPEGDEGQAAISEQGGSMPSVEDLLQELEATRAKEAEYLDGWQRARAELANARKRFQREQEQSYTNAKADLLFRLLPIVDDFERALETLPSDLSGLSWIDGISLIQRKMQMLLEQEQVTAIEAAGREFDPFAHQAVTHEPSESIPAGQIIAEMQKGYRMGERVLRPSMVRVSSGPASEPEGEEIAKETEE
jgi:molecular chaperone GrpE